MRATLKMRSRSLTEEPPNFCTIKPIGVLSPLFLYQLTTAPTLSASRPMHGKMAQRAVRSQRCLCAGEKLGVVLVHNGHDGRPGARDVNGLRTQVLRQLKDVVTALDQRQAVLLVQHVLGRHTQQRVVALAEGRRGQRRAGQVVDGILMADHGGSAARALLVSRRKSGTNAANASSGSMSFLTL